MLVALQPLNHSVDARTLSGGERRAAAHGAGAFVADAPVLIPETEVLSDLIGTSHHTTLVCLLNRSIGAVAGSLQYLLKV